jgi:hypothetical protein
MGAIPCTCGDGEDQEYHCPLHGDKKEAPGIPAPLIIGIVGQAGSGKDAVGTILRGHYGFATLAFADPLKTVVMEAWNLPREVLWGASDGRTMGIMECAACGWTGVDLDCPVCCDNAVLNVPITVWACPKGCTHPTSVFDPPKYAPICNHNDALTRQPLTPRLALQTLGTQWGRALDPDVWIRITLRRARALCLSRGARHAGTRIPVDAGYPYKIKGVAITDCRFPNEASAIRRAGGVIWRVDRPGPEYPGYLTAPREGRGGAAAWRGHSSETAQECIAGDRLIVNDGDLDVLRGKVEHALAETGVTDDA